MNGRAAASNASRFAVTRGLGNFSGPAAVHDDSSERSVRSSREPSSGRCVMMSPQILAGAAAFAFAVAGCSAGNVVQPGLAAPLASVAASSRPPFVFPDGCCFYAGRVVRTVVPPANTPQEGRDNFYAFPNGAAAGQKGVVAVAPGARDYHGGHWAFLARSEEHTSELQSLAYLVCRLLLGKKKNEFRK